MARIVACALALAVALAMTVHAKSSCDVSVTGAALSNNAVYTASCNSVPRSTVTYSVTSDAAYRVYFTDGSDCTADQFRYYESLSFGVNTAVGAGTTSFLIVKANYADGEWAYPCVRVKSVGAATNLRVTVEWSPMNFANQFHLQNTGQYQGVAGNDVNANGAWTASPAVTGNGVVVDICDDGLQAAHVEIYPRVRLDLSQNMQTGNANPTGGASDDHGTGCGGVAAADGDNSDCGKGAAYHAQLAGHRILFAGATDAHYADAMWNATQPVDVSSNSWGPEGCTSSGCDYSPPTATVKNAIATAFTDGRQGRGKPFVFAAGNEGYYGGDCNQYAYTKLTEAITVAGSSYKGEQVWYSSAGACLFVNSPTQGQKTLQPLALQLTPGIITAQGSSSDNTLCRDDFGGTSSATPLVAGVIALVMEANPRATSRDIQRLLQSTATQNDASDPSWVTNGASVKFSRKYGFGRVNAGAAVTAARSASWKTASPLITYTTPVVSAGGVSINGTPKTQSTTVTSNVQSIENVILYITASWSTGVAYLHIRLTSPAGTAVDLAVSQTQKSGNVQAVFDPPQYPFGARAFWGENSNGVWTVAVDSGIAGSGSGAFTDFKIEFAGTAPNSACTGCTDTNAVCAQNGAGALVCQCARGYTGTPGSCAASNMCASMPCQNGGTCVEGSGTYQCRCPGTTALYDSQCALKDSLCNPNPCQNGGTCYLSGSNTYGCKCTNPSDTTRNCGLSAAHTVRSSVALVLAVVAAVVVAVFAM